MAGHKERINDTSYAAIEKLIIAQLQAALPASLTEEFLIEGVYCAGQNFAAAEITDVLSGLCARQEIIKISEGGLSNRYRLVDNLEGRPEERAGDE